MLKKAKKTMLLATLLVVVISIPLLADASYCGWFEWNGNVYHGTITGSRMTSSADGTMYVEPPVTYCNK